MKTFSASKKLGERITGEIEVISGGRQEKVYLPVFNPAYPTVGELKGWYVEDNGCVQCEF